MKLKPEFITHITENEAMLVPLGSSSFHGIVRGNATLGKVLELLKNETTEDAITDAMCKIYNAPRETIAADVHRAVEQLKEIGAIDD